MSESDLKRVASQVLPKKFFDRDTLEVARDLLGKILWIRTNPAFSLDDPRSHVTAGRIVETEAYHGDDPASHSSRGETLRNAVMFGPAGVAYVYFIYGMYQMLNFVTERKGYPGAVLIRAVEPIYGVEWMKKRRGAKTPLNQLTNGPGKLTQAMGIQMTHNGESLQGPRLYVTDDGFRPARVGATPRVGITQAKAELWRFIIPDHSFISQVPQNKIVRDL